MDVSKYLKELKKLIKKVDFLNYLKIIFLTVSIVLSKNNLFFITNAGLIFSILNSFVKKENDKFGNKFVFDFEIFIFQSITLFYLNRQTLLMGIKLFDIEYFSKVILNARYLNGELLFFILFSAIYIYKKKEQGIQVLYLYNSFIFLFI